MLPIFVIIIIGITIYPMESAVNQSQPSSTTRPSRFYYQRDTGTQPEDFNPSGVLIDNIRTITVKIRRLEFNPNPIVAIEGETVRLEVTSQDAAHNIVIEKLGINQRVEPMVPKVIEFQASRPGRYQMTCSVNCGIANQHLDGELIIQNKPSQQRK
jgi:heme/copper-type cytochrome/quinol oxidase subunit 2